MAEAAARTELLNLEPSNWEYVCVIVYGVSYTGMYKCDIHGKLINICVCLETTHQHFCTYSTYNRAGCIPTEYDTRCQAQNNTLLKATYMILYFYLYLAVPFPKASFGHQNLIAVNIMLCITFVYGLKKIKKNIWDI